MYVFYFSEATRQSVVQLRRRYPSLYIPSDFTEAVIDWPVTTPVMCPLSISVTPISFNVLHKEIDCPDTKLPPLFAPDADPRYSSKVRNSNLVQTLICRMLSDSFTSR